ncbi:MAG: hypothetical protein IPL79_03995 [Myxococcales bacterium]|nr:hypothetical protein [Myxococcales bacterium]
MKIKTKSILAMSLVCSMGAGCLSGESGSADDMYKARDLAPVPTAPELGFEEQVDASIPIGSINESSQAAITEMGWKFYVCPEFIHNMASTFKSQGIDYGSPGIAPPPGIWGQTQSGHVVTEAKLFNIGAPGLPGAPAPLPFYSLHCESDAAAIQVSSRAERAGACIAVNNGSFHGFICQ